MLSPAGRQSRDSGYTAFTIAGGSFTATVPSTVHPPPAFAPESHTPSRQRGHTCVAVPRYVAERSASGIAWASSAPVRRSTVASMVGSANRLTSHTATLAEKSGIGGPNATLLIEPAPVGALARQTESSAPSHPDK